MLGNGNDLSLRANRPAKAPLGVLINHLDYDSFGNVLLETNPLFGDRYRFTGREFDPELALYYYRARYYDPAIGRFTTEDPIAFAGGDANLYRYVGNSPLTYVDPWGLTTVGYATYTSEDAKTAPAKILVACMASEVFFMTAFAAMGIPPDVFDIGDAVLDCIAEAASGGGSAANRIGDKLHDAGKAADKIKDAAKGTDKAKDAGKAAGKANDAGRAGDKAAEGTRRSGKKHSDSSKAERHGDSGRTLSKAEKQIADLQKQLDGATGREAKKLRQKIQNIRKAAQKAKRGETHHRR